MSVIGIDFGNYTCYIAVARAGGIETIANEFSQRHTPTCVAFGSHNRMMGVAAKNQQVTNLRNTIIDFKQLLGRAYDDSMVTEVATHELTCQLVPVSGCGTAAGEQETVVRDDSQQCVGVRVQYREASTVFRVEQITAMLFTKLKIIGEAALNTRVQDVVISVPAYFTDRQRHALLCSAQIAGLHVLQLMNDTTATALSYGIYKQDLPAVTEPSRYVAFVDCGHTATQVAICAFNTCKLRVISYTGNVSVGGIHFDRVLFDHFCDQFAQQYNMDVRSNRRASLRLMTECERLKKQMSANSNQLPLNIECFMADVDVCARIDRATFEQLSGDLLQRCTHTLQQCVHEFVTATGLSLANIDCVQMVGGSSRVPALKRAVEQVFGVAPSTTLNQDEAVARGCALQCAVLSPTFKVREFNVVDLQPYPICLSWPSGNMKIFNKNHEMPYSKLITFNEVEEFCLHASYEDKLQYFPISHIGSYTVRVPAQDKDSKQATKIKVKVRVNSNGMFMVPSATLFERAEEPVSADVTMSPGTESGAVDTAPAAAPSDTPMSDAGADTAKRNGDSPEDVSMQAADGQPTSAAGDQNGSAGGADTPAADTAQQQLNGDDAATSTHTKAEKKCRTKRTDLLVDTLGDAQYVSGLKLSASSLSQLVVCESRLVHEDQLECERQDAKNQLEEFVYASRDQLGLSLKPFTEPEQYNMLLNRLDSMESWLYDEEGGDACGTEVYRENLRELRAHMDPITGRYKEHENRPAALLALTNTLNRAEKIVTAFRCSGAGAPNDFSHLDAAGVDKVEKAIVEKRHWLDNAMNTLSNLLPCANPTITVQQLYGEQKEFEAMANPILNKPKPKPEPANTTATPTSATNSTNSDANSTSTQQQRTGVDSSQTDAPIPPVPETHATHTMDVD